MIDPDDMGGYAGYEGEENDEITPDLWQRPVGSLLVPISRRRDWLDNSWSLLMTDNIHK